MFRAVKILRFSLAARRLLAGAFLFAISQSPALAAEALKPGDTLDSLATPKATYRDVKIRSINPRSVMITHSGGMTSVPLRDLSPELQTRFGYDPSAENPAQDSSAKTPAPKAPAPPAPAKSASKSPATGKPSAFDALLQKFGQPVTPAAETTLRPKFSELGIGARSQGSRPSCAVYAIVCALEFQTATAGKALNFSEDYLIWAARRTTQRVPAAAPDAGKVPEPGEEADEGFVLAEVVTALRAYGVALQDQMPNTRGRFAAIPNPSPELVATAREQQNVAVHRLPGRDVRTRLANLVHAINAGFPVPIGLAWPHWRAARSGFLNAQKPPPGSWHAVTVVGYRSTSGTLEDTQFIFKNSYGFSWGQGGYGVATYTYLQEHLHDAILLEIQPRRTTP